MRRTRTAELLLAGGLVLGAPALSACSDDAGVEETEDGGAIVDDTTDTGEQDLENDVEDLDDEGAVDGVEEEPDAQ